MGYYDDSIPFDYATSSTYSLSDGTLWLGTNLGLYNLSWNADEGVSLANYSSVESQPVLSLAWRSLITEATDFKLNKEQFAFAARAGVHNHVQESFACSCGSGVRWTGSYWGQNQERRALVVRVGVSLAGWKGRGYRRHC